jgi:hypothetical protein
MPAGSLNDRVANGDRGMWDNAPCRSAEALLAGTCDDLAKLA